MKQKIEQIMYVLGDSDPLDLTNWPLKYYLDENYASSRRSVIEEEAKVTEDGKVHKVRITIEVIEE